MSVGTTSAASARVSTARYAANPENRKKIAAKSAIRTAVRNGTLEKPSSCPRCGRNVPLDFHHTDKTYSSGSKLKGKFLCRRCHSALDPSRAGKSMSKSMKKAKPTNT